MNSCASSHETRSTGQSNPHASKNDGLLPITASHCPCVTSYLPISKDRLIRTRVNGPSRSNASELVDPIRNSPSGILTNSIPTLLRTSAGPSEGLSAGGDGGGGDGGDTTVRAAPPLLAGARADAPNLKLTDQSAN